MTHTVKNRHNNIIYKKGDIVQDLQKIINTKSRNGCDVLFPQCVSENQSAITRLNKEIYALFPSLQIDTEFFVSNPKNYAHTQFLTIPNTHNKNLNKIIFANMFCVKKNHTKRKISYVALARCMNDVYTYIKKESSREDSDKIQIMSAKFGTGFIGGNWSFIEQLINDSWDSFTTTIYQYDSKS